MRVSCLYIIALFLFSSLLLAQKVQAAESLFFETLYDIPVMHGLSEVKEMSVSFDKAEGRIAYAAAVSKTIDKKGVLAFYAEVLPQMGWQAVTPVLFTREQEKLEISFEKNSAAHLVRFSLRPALK